MDETEIAAATAAGSPGAASTVELDLHGDGQLPAESERKAAAADVAALGGLGDDSDDEEAAEAAMRAKYGLAAGPAASSGRSEVEEEAKSADRPGPQDFKWDDAGAMAGLTKENSELKSQLKEQSRTIGQLEEALLAVKPTPGLEPEKFLSGRSAGGIEAGVDVDPRDDKIKELAKRTRKLNLALQKEKDARNTAQRDVQRLVAELESATKEGESGHVAAASRSPGKTAGQVRSLQRKLVAANAQLEAAKSSTALAHKALAAEVGPDVPVADVIASFVQSSSAASAGTTGLAGGTSHATSGAAGGGWRGRSQKIVLLRTKVKKLQAALAEAGEGGAPAPSGPPSPARSRRSRTLEFLAGENEELRGEVTALRQRVDATKARMRVVDMERKKGSAQLTTLLAKTDNDDKLIEALRTEVGHLEHRLEEAKRAAASAPSASTLHLGSQRGGYAPPPSHGGPGPDGMTPAHAHAHSEATRLGGLVGDQARRLETADRVIASLKGEVAALRASAGPMPGGAGGLPHPASRPSSADIRHMSGLEVAALETDARNRLLTLQVAQLGESLEAAAQRAGQAEGTVQSYMARSAQLEARCRELEGAGARVGPPGDTAALQAAVATLQNSAQAASMHHASSLAAREAEAGQLRHALATVNAAWEGLVGEVRAKAAAVGMPWPTGPPPPAAGGMAPPPGGQLQPLPGAAYGGGQGPPHPAPKGGARGGVRVSPVASGGGRQR